MDNTNDNMIGPMAVNDCIAEIHVDRRKCNNNTVVCPPDFYQMPLATSREGVTVPPYAYPDPYLTVRTYSGEIWAKWGYNDRFYFNYMAGGNDFTSGNPDTITGQRLSEGSRPGSYPTRSILNMPKTTDVTLRDGRGNPIANDQNLVLVSDNTILHRGNPKTNSAGLVRYCVGNDHTNKTALQLVYNAPYKGFMHSARVNVTRGGTATYQFPPEARVTVIRMGAPARNVPVRCAFSIDGNSWYAGDPLYTNASGVVEFCIPTVYQYCYFFNPETGSETQETFAVGSAIEATLLDVVPNTPALDDPILLDGGSVYFSWADLSATPNHLTYMIGIAQNGTMLLQGQVDNNYVVINGFAANQTYQYQIAAFDTQGRLYAMSATMSFTVPFVLESAFSVSSDGSLAGIGVKKADDLAEKVSKTKVAGQKHSRLQKAKAENELQRIGGDYTVVSMVKAVKSE